MYHIINGTHRAHSLSDTREMIYIWIYDWNPSEIKQDLFVLTRLAHIFHRAFYRSNLFHANALHTLAICFARSAHPFANPKYSHKLCVGGWWRRIEGLRLCKIYSFFLFHQSDAPRTAHTHCFTYQHGALKYALSATSVGVLENIREVVHIIVAADVTLATHSAAMR